jgi:membrane protein implicated in regulation of membrane protease activity
MANATIWWLLAGSLVALELFTGTFYLLMLSLGMVAAALAAHAGLGLAAQFVLAALLGSAAVVAWYWVKKRGPGEPSVRSLRSVNLDVGEVIHVEQWAADGTTSVRYRGAQWTVIQPPGSAALPGPYRVTELVGNRLLVEKV